MAVERRQLDMQPTQIKNPINPTHQVIRRNHRVEIEIVKQALPITSQPTHHRSVPRNNRRKTESRF